MSNYPTYKQLNLFLISEKIKKEWKEDRTFLKSANKPGKGYVLYEGPPAANGQPGIHHALSRTLKDLFGRYKTMQGFQVFRRGGWDTHGLPVELQVEKKLGITKKDIGVKIKIEDYNKACRSAVFEYKKKWEEFTSLIGYWTDLKKPYITCDPGYISALWGLLALLYKKKLLYKGYNIQPYSPAAGTGLSSHELNQPGCYKEVKDLSAVTQFRSKKNPNTYFLAWTTTPWTLPANAALAINQKIYYLRVATFNRYTKAAIEVILAEKSLANYFLPDQQKAKMVAPSQPQAPLPFRILERFQGKELIGEKYEPLFTYIKPKKTAFEIFHADFVHTTEGTGIVHISPCFGSDDYQLAQKYNLDQMRVIDKEGLHQPIVDLSGRYVKEMGDWANRPVKDGYATEKELEKADYENIDISIVTKLKKMGLIFLSKKYTHNYPHCWRTNKPILYYPIHAWFIKTTACRERLVELNKTIHWQPESTGSGRFGNWLENVSDWNLSRSRFWGTPLPIWRTSDNQEEKCIDSLESLRKEVAKSVEKGFMKSPLPKEIDLHRPYIDKIVLVSERGKPMERVPDLIDVWFDSGGMPYAQHHINMMHSQELPKNYPANLIIEGIDQTRGWFFTLHALSVLLFDQVAYKQVLATGLVLDKEGRKMSKSLGNTLDPIELIKKEGPDLLRWYMVSNNSSWENLRFDKEKLLDIKKKFFDTLHHTYQFFALYANLDRFQPESGAPSLTDCTQMDKWILARLHQLIQQVSSALDKLAPTLAARAIEKFTISELSNWYIRRNRSRFWQAQKDAKKQAAYQTLYTCLTTIAKLAAPIAPFYMDQLYRDLTLNRKESVHLKSYPKAEAQYIDRQLIKTMEQAQIICSLVHGLRKEHHIKVRQPLQKIALPITSGLLKREALQKVEKIILDEVNVKEIEYIQDTGKMVLQQLVPNYPYLGKKYKKELPAIAKVIQSLSYDQVPKIVKEGKYEVVVEGKKIQLTDESWLVSTKEIKGWHVATQQGITVALKSTISPSLEEEGLARELVNRLQNLRKEKGLAVEKKIRLELFLPNKKWEKVVASHKTYILQQVQIKELFLIEQKKAFLDKILINKETLQAAIISE